jgi:Fur family ferric uptake transcriptional regulator
MGIVRRTRSVTALLDEFEKGNDAISAIELLKRLGERFNKTTVYRILDRLEDDGILHSFLGNDGIKWYAKCQNCSKEGHTDVHPHFQCTHCGKVECLSIEVRIPKLANRQVETSHLLIQGKCETCSG